MKLRLGLIYLLLIFVSCNSEVRDSKEEVVSESSELKDSSVKVIEQPNEFQSGDIIFQTSKSSQSKAIQEATGSRYSHCGIIYLMEGKVMVYEAIQPVKLTPIKEWIARGVDGEFVVKRLKNADDILTDQSLKKMMQVGKKYNGLNYDLYFEWSDDRIYCSELVWKIYKKGLGIELGDLKQLKSFKLDSPAVKAKIKERYGANIPLDMPVIAPVDIFESELLVEVKMKEVP